MIPANPTNPNNPAHATDAELLAAHVTGDPDAFDLLLRRHRTRLWAVALRTLGDAEEAADALQDACLSAYRRAETYRGESAVTTWLHRIVVNACLDRMRRRAARPALALVEDHPGLPSVPDATGAWDDADAVATALAGLPDDQRVALVLVDMEGYPIAEVAALLGVAEGTVKSRCSRGRVRLRSVLAATFGRVPGSGGNPRGVSGVPSASPVALVPDPGIPPTEGQAAP